jgi:hypothetical protein
MKKLFTHENRLIVSNIRNLLEGEGIECQLRNEFAGGGVGDLAPFDIWPELWVADEDIGRGIEVLNELQQENLIRRQCPACGAENDGHFRLCWQCCEPLAVANLERPII